MSISNLIRMFTGMDSLVQVTSEYEVEQKRDLV